MHSGSYPTDLSRVYSLVHVASSFDSSIKNSRRYYATTVRVFSFAQRCQIGLSPLEPPRSNSCHLGSLAIKLYGMGVTEGIHVLCIKRCYVLSDIQSVQQSVHYILLVIQSVSYMFGMCLYSSVSMLSMMFGGSYLLWQH
jgi:hypothetical protein